MKKLQKFISREPRVIESSGWCHSISEIIFLRIRYSFNQKFNQELDYPVLVKFPNEQIMKVQNCKLPPLLK